MRRIFLILVALFTLTQAAFASEVGEDGLHKQPWFTTTFKDIAEDIATARDSGKRLAIIFEQRGCIYCKRLHETVLNDPKIAKFISENFQVVQYNLFGDEEVVDLDGETLTEKTAARKWRVVYTPTIMFLPEKVEGKNDAGRAAVSTMPGAFGKGTTLNMFRWVHDKGYEGDEHFQKYHARMLAGGKASDN